MFKKNNQGFEFQSMPWEIYKRNLSDMTAIVYDSDYRHKMYQNIGNN